MAYNRKNMLLRIIEIQNEVKKHKALGVPQTVIWREHIWPRWKISYSCYNYYLTVPAYAELQKIERKERDEPKQYSLFG
jgi:hypothetical protein